MLINLKKFFKKKPNAIGNIKKIELLKLKKTYTKKANIENAAKRKNYIMLFLLAITSWMSLFYIIIEINPSKTGASFMFFFVVYFCLYFTLYLFLFNKRRASVYSTATVIYIFFRFIGLGNVLYAISILFLAILYDRITSRRI